MLTIDCSRFKVFNTGSNTNAVRLLKGKISGISGFLEILEFPEKILTVQVRLRLRLFKPLFKLFNLNESRISLNSCWVVEVVKNREHREHLGKVVLKEARRRLYLYNTHT